MEMKLLAGLHHRKDDSESVTLEILRDEQGDLHLVVQEKGMFNQRSQAVRVYSVMGDSVMRCVHEKLVELAELINEEHDKHPRHPAFIPGVKKDDGCICTRVCDCEHPEPAEGVALVSDECPVHNHNPKPNPECTARIHHFALSK